MIKNLKQFNAFTLAEVLITLGIIGVVAAMTLPTLVSNIQDRVRAKRIENIHQKLSKVTDKMAATSDLRGYAGTQAFVEEMKKHMNIAKICDNSHLEECWPTTEVDIGYEKIWEIKNTKTKQDLQIRTDGWDDTVGIVTGDGSSMILSYNKNCSFNPDKGFTYSSSSGKSNSLNCLSGVYDWNGSSRPNKLGEDVMLLGMATGLGDSCAFKVGSVCYSAPFLPEFLSPTDCENLKNEGKIPNCPPQGYFYGRDNWGGAVSACGGQSFLPSIVQLTDIAKLLYKGNPNISSDYHNGPLVWDETDGYDLNSSIAKNFSLSADTNFIIWSRTPYGNYNAWGRVFRPNETATMNGFGGRYQPSVLAICVNSLN